MVFVLSCTGVVSSALEALVARGLVNADAINSRLGEIETGIDGMDDEDVADIKNAFAAFVSK